MSMTRRMPMNANPKVRLDELTEPRLTSDEGSILAFETRRRGWMREGKGRYGAVCPAASTWA